MIISKIQGGIGNQMFQYAYSRHLSLKYSIDLFLDIDFYNLNHGYTNRKFLLNNFKIECKTKSKSNEHIIFDTFSYRENNIDPKKSYYIDGYWQSEKYFIDSKESIKKDFSLNKSKQDGNISIHVRRTDYISSNGYHPVQSIQYYKNAIDYLGEYNQLLIFSDDIGWCEENFNFKNMIFIKNNSEIEDLSMMSSCDHNIIANSSFSWWGAWLNINPMKKIISPSKWFGDHVNISDADIIPNEWIKI